MRSSNKISLREIQFFIFMAMIFAVCEVLSIQLNHYFNDIIIFGYHFLFNVSVVFFCLSFFIMDLVTELYDNKVSDYFIYAKLVSQVLFVLLGGAALSMAGIETGQLHDSFYTAPFVLLDSVIASLIGYKFTGWVMQYLKVKLRGQFLFSRYLSSTFPGEILFSLIFTLLSFSSGQEFSEVLNIFVDLVAIKFVLSLAFSLLIVPVTNILRQFLSIHPIVDDFETLPFK